MLPPTNDDIWQTWVERLHQWGLGALAALLLEAAGPFNLVSAQLVYIGQPVLSNFLPAKQLTALAGLLEDPGETQAFVKVLREAAP